MKQQPDFEYIAEILDDYCDIHDEGLIPVPAEYSSASVKEQVELLKNAATEIDALRAQVENLRAHILWYDDCDTSASVRKARTDMVAAAKQTPAQCLAEVGVQERRYGFVAGYGAGWASKSLGKPFSPEWSASEDAYDYANQIRQQSQEQSE